MKFRLVLAGLLVIGSGDLAAAATKDVEAKPLQPAAKAKAVQKKKKPESQSAAANQQVVFVELPAPHKGRGDHAAKQAKAAKSPQAEQTPAETASADTAESHNAAAPDPTAPAKSRRHDKHQKSAHTQPGLVNEQDPMVATHGTTLEQDKADLKQVVRATNANLDTMIAHYAARYEVPESLVRRVVKRESQFHPGLRNGPYWGLMQIRPDTARGMGYHGAPTGLLNAETNLNYAVPYLANAWRLAGGSETRAVQLYAGGYYYVAKRRGMLDQMIKSAGPVE